MECMTAIFLATAIAALIPNIEIGQVVTPPVIIVFFIFAGVFINVDSLPNGSAWVAQVSLLKWAYQALMLNEFTGRTYQRITAKGV